MQDDRSVVKIRPDLYSEIEKIVAQSQQFDSVEALVDFVLNEVISSGASCEPPLSDAIEARLKQLGYL